MGIGSVDERVGFVSVRQCRIKLHAISALDAHTSLLLVSGSVACGLRPN